MKPEARHYSDDKDAVWRAFALEPQMLIMAMNFNFVLRFHHNGSNVHIAGGVICVTRQCNRMCMRCWIYQIGKLPAGPLRGSSRGKTFRCDRLLSATLPRNLAFIFRGERLPRKFQKHGPGRFARLRVFDSKEG